MFNSQYFILLNNIQHVLDGVSDFFFKIAEKNCVPADQHKIKKNITPKKDFKEYFFLI